MSKASEYAKIRHAAMLAPPAWVAPNGLVAATVTKEGGLFVNGTVLAQHIPALVAWIKETFED